MLLFNFLEFDDDFSSEEEEIVVQYVPRLLYGESFL